MTMHRKRKPWIKKVLLAGFAAAGILALRSLVTQESGPRLSPSTPAVQHGITFVAVSLTPSDETPADAPPPPPPSWTDRLLNLLHRRKGSGPPLAMSYAASEPGGFAV